MVSTDHSWRCRTCEEIITAATLLELISAMQAHACNRKKVAEQLASGY